MARSHNSDRYGARGGYRAHVEQHAGDRARHQCSNTGCTGRSGQRTNLTSNATFQKMVKAAPSGAAATGYVSTAALGPLLGTSTAEASSLFSHVDALAFTLVWNNSVLQGTFDTALHS